MLFPPRTGEDILPWAQRLTAALQPLLNLVGDGSTIRAKRIGRSLILESSSPSTAGDSHAFEPSNSAIAGDLDIGIGWIVFRDASRQNFEASGAVTLNQSGYVCIWIPSNNPEEYYFEINQASGTPPKLPAQSSHWVIPIYKVTLTGGGSFTLKHLQSSNIEI